MMAMPYGMRPACARAIRAGAVAGLFAVSAGCGSALNSPANQSSSIVIVDSLQAASGATPENFSGVLASDVQTIQAGASTVLEDIGQVTFQLALKDPGTPTAPSTPTTANYVTLTSYTVTYSGAPGVTVPAGFTDGISVTVGNQPATATFVLVLKQAKTAAPLVSLIAGGGEIATTAQITFSGQDQTGHMVTATAQIAVNFANWPDPA